MQNKDEYNMEFGFDLQDELNRAGFCFDENGLIHATPSDNIHITHNHQQPSSTIPTEQTTRTIQCTRCLLFCEPCHLQSCEGAKNYGCYSKWCTLCFTSVFQTHLQSFGCGCCPIKRTKRGRKANNDINMREISQPTLISCIKNLHEYQKNDRLDRLEKIIIHINKHLDDIIQIYQAHESDSD